MNEISFVPLQEIQRIRQTISDPLKRAEVLADVFRLNVLYMIMYAGSGHPGTCLSCMDIMTWLLTEEMTSPNEKDANPSDQFFSSKGHDAPALYTILMGMGKLDFKYINTLRRLHGLPGHPDIGTPYIIANTGSLGMGIAKAHGMAKAFRLQGKKGHFYVMTGDGELQEGNIWESLQPTVNGNYAEITVIVDNNKIQSDIFVEQTSRLGALEEKFKAFGWEVARCDGHDMGALRAALARFKNIHDRPQALIADTVKGKGVSCMEKMGEDGYYKFHSGAPSVEIYEKAFVELEERVRQQLVAVHVPMVSFETNTIPARTAPHNPQKLVAAYADELIKIARERRDIVALDADLVLDTGLIPFKKEFPDRYSECGIAEQDMVAMAGGLALKGMLPAVHSFACFLSTRPNEHFYTNASEKTKIIYTGSLAGVLPAAPGHSHQSVRDISALGSIPGLTLIEPCDEREARLAIRFAVEENTSSTYIRLVSIPSEISYTLPEQYALVKGRGVKLCDGADGVAFAYGPTILSEVFKAAQHLKQQGISIAVYNMPWLNDIDEAWLRQECGVYPVIMTFDDHYVRFGQGEMIAAACARLGLQARAHSFGLTEIPECGQSQEVLAYHGLDCLSIAKDIESKIKSK